MALPNSRIVPRQPAVENGYGQTSDIEIQAQELLRVREMLEKLLAEHSGRPTEEIRQDMECDRFFRAQAARECGLIDEIVARRDLGSVLAAAPQS